MQLTPATILQMFQLNTADDHLYAVLDGIPDDATARRAFFDVESHRVCIVVSHEDFPEVPDGEFLPRATPNKVCVFTRAKAIGRKAQLAMDLAFSALHSEGVTDSQRVTKAAETLEQWVTK